MATSTEYSVYLSVFQLPERTHFADQVFKFTPVWILLVVAQTTMEVHTYTSTTSSIRSPLFGRRVQLWQIIQDLGSNSVKRFHMEKRLHSNEIGQNGCYFIRRLANNLGEPQRSYAINAIDRALTFWKAKRVRKPVPLRAPWLLATDWTRQLRQLLTTHVHGTKHYNTTLQTPSTGIVFTKFPSVMDSLCNHKEAATRWADGEAPKRACSAFRPHSLPSHQPDQHQVLDGDNLRFADAPFTSIATGSLQNKIFPPSREIYTSLRSALQTWTTKNSLPSLPKVHLDELWQRSIHSHHTSLHNHITHKDITRFKQLFPEAIFHNEDKRATSLRIYCPVIYFQCLTKTFADPLVFRKLEDSPNYIIEKTIAEITKQFGKSYPWALGSGRDLPNAYILPKRKKQFLAGRQIVSFFTAPFRPIKILLCIQGCKKTQGSKLGPADESRASLAHVLFLAHTQDHPSKDLSGQTNQ